MATQHTRFQNLELIAGTALIGLGIFIQSENLIMAAAQVNHLLGISADRTETLGLIVTVGLAASHALQAYFFDHENFCGVSTKYRYHSGLCWPSSPERYCCVTDSQRKLKNSKSDPAVSKNQVWLVDFVEAHSTRK
jgi:hypothetical protein